MKQYIINFLDEYLKGVLLIDEINNKEFFIGLFDAMYNQLLEPKSKKKNMQIKIL